MENLSFWIIAGALALGVALLLILGQRRAPGAALPAGGEDLKVYRDQLAEVDRDLARGTLAEAEAQRLRTEISRRLLDADRALRSAAPAAAPRAACCPAALILAAAAGALLIYRQTGVPGYPDLPLASAWPTLTPPWPPAPARPRNWPARASRPTPPPLPRSRPNSPPRPTPRRSSPPSRPAFAAGELRAAVLTMERRIALLGEAASSADFSGLAIALVTEAQG